MSTNARLRAAELPRRSFAIAEFRARNGLTERQTERLIALGLIKVFWIGRLRRVAVEEEDRIVREGIQTPGRARPSDMSAARAAAAAKRKEAKAQ